MRKKKVLLIGLAVALVLTLGVGTVWAGTAQPASKATAAVGYINVISDGEAAESLVMAQEIKIPGNKKDLLVDVSLETGLYTETVVRSKKAEQDIATASARIEVMVQAIPIDNDGLPTGAPIIAHPNLIVGYDNGDPVYNGGWVTFDYRMQVLSATLQGIINDIVCELGPGPDGIPGTADDVVTCVINEDTLTPEEIGLLLSTMAAHSFNFILMDLPVDTYRVEVWARVADSIELGGTELGEAEANATIGLGSVTIEVVRMIRGEVIEVVSPPLP